MTLWNPLNVFSGKSSTDEGHPVEGTAASYDPSRVGDPVGSPLGAPAIGYGDTRVGTSVAGPSDPHRNPIGFAPPLSDVPDTPARFRTEISFRRHHELPRASAMPLPPDEDARTAWQSPELDTPSTEEAEVHEAHETEHETRTPFFRREISFRRKKSDGVSPEAEVVDVWPSVDEPDGDAVADVDSDAEVETAEVEHLAVRHEDGAENAPVEDAPGEDAPVEDVPSLDAVHEVDSHDDVADAADETEAFAEPVAK